MKLVRYTGLPALLLLLMLAGCGGQVKKTGKTEAHNGMLDLAGWNFFADGNVSLDGDWAFYWDALLPPGELAGKAPTGYYRLPSGWAKYKALRLPSHGCATYRLVVSTDAAEGIYGISVPNVYTDYALWLNGSLVHACGSFARSKTVYLHPQAYDFHYVGSKLEIILQVKNDALVYGGGVGQSIRLGTSALIHRERNIRTAADVFLISICLFAGLFFLILRYFRKDGSELVWLFVLCFSVSLRNLLSNTMLIMQIVPSLPFWLGSRLVMLTVPVIIVSMLFYSRRLYNELMPQTAFRVLLSLNVLYIFAVLALPSAVYSAAFVPYLPTVAAACALGCYVSVAAVKRRERESVFFLLGMLILTLGALLDSLVYLSVLAAPYMLSAALFGFIIVQVVLQSKRYSEAFRRTELLSADLQASLDKVMNTETAFLNAQIKPHFLYNALNVIAECCRTNPPEAEKLIVSLSKYLRGTLDFENLQGLIPLKKELDLVRAYTSIEKARFEDIRVTFEIADPLPEIQIPPLTIQPLVENAIKHGLRGWEGGGVVTVRAAAVEGGVCFCVKDNGTGIDEKKLGTLLDAPKGSASIGLYNINTRLFRLYGKGLCIQSTVNAGTSVSFEIPAGEGLTCSG